jgi:hypothetical protein
MIKEGLCISRHHSQANIIVPEGTGTLQMVQMVNLSKLYIVYLNNNWILASMSVT